MERVGGFVVVDLSTPKAPEIVQYINNRDFTLTDTVGPDGGPEIIDFVDARNSPTADRGWSSPTRSPAL